MYPPFNQGGIEFRKHYANAPVCCPSRATFWSGRHASNIPHEHNGIEVGGAWNNYEGLPDNYTDRIDQVLTRTTGYNVKVNGKTVRVTSYICKTTTPDLPNCKLRLLLQHNPTTPARQDLLPVPLRATLPSPTRCIGRAMESSHEKRAKRGYE